MLYPSIDKLLNQIGSKYLLVNVVAKRAKEIRESGHRQMPDKDYNSIKPIGMALEEISNNLIEIYEK
ncbi:MAG: DNA-directed RNA polymerase subunit omega [Bacilli bacterium]|nr:DNA-directed RNA polymerase subunit omega [Bacilli bacterium]MDD4282997.1 DNA-directed RNA polymerase subunit omega [Bacilli bacterium]